MPNLGTAFATLFERTVSVAWISLAAFLIQACVVPADIVERPPADVDGDFDMDEGYEYQPIIIPDPIQGEVLIPQDCPQFWFYARLAEMPDEDDTARINNMEFRWFLNYSRNPAVIQFDSLTSEKVYRLNLSDIDPEEINVLQVIVSDLGFKEGDAQPLNRAPEEGAGTYESVWVIRLIESPILDEQQDCNVRI